MEFQLYDNLVDNFALALDAIPVKQGESLESYFIRILEKVKDRNKRKEVLD